MSLKEEAKLEELGKESQRREEQIIADLEAGAETPTPRHLCSPVAGQSQEDLAGQGRLQLAMSPREHLGCAQIANKEKFSRAE